MNRRTWIGLGLVLLVLLTGLVLSVNWAVGRYLSPSGVSAQLSEALNREVTVEEVGFSIWTGVRVSGITVSEHPDFDAGTWLAADSIDLKPEWWPLLYGELSITDARVVRPEISLRRSSEGEWILFRGFDSEQGGEDGSTEPADDSSALQLQVDQITLTDGKVRLQDEVLGVSDQLGFRQISLHEFGLDGGGELSLRDVRFPGGQLSATGAVRMGPIRADLESMQLAVDRPGELSGALEAYLPAGTQFDGGSLNLEVSGGTIGPEGVDLSFQGSATENRLDGVGEDPIHWNEVDYQGRFELNLPERTVQLELSDVRLSEGSYGTDPMHEFAGTLSRVVFTVDTDHGESPWALQTELSSVRVRPAFLDRPVDLRSGRVTVTQDSVRTEDVTGTVQGTAFETEARFPLPFALDNPFEGHLSVDPLAIGSIRGLASGSLFPAGLDVGGSVSTSDLRIRGSLLNPVFAGTVRVAEFHLQPEALAHPVTLPEGTLTFRDEQVILEDLGARFRDHALTLSGTVRQRDPRTLSLQAEFSRLPVETVRSGLTDPPEFPESWKPEGELSGMVRITGTPTAPVVRGSLSTPSFSLGRLAGEQGELEFRFQDDSLTVSSLRLNAYGGQFVGEGTVDSLVDQPTVESRFTFERVRVGDVLVDFTGQGGESSGQIDVQGTVSGPMQSRDELTGSLQATGGPIQLRGIPAISSIDAALVQGISGALGEDLGPLVSQVLTRSMPEQMEGLRRVFEPSTISDFDRLDLRVNLGEGIGRIQHGTLENPELSLNLGGTVRLDGRLDSSVQIQARQPLIRKANQTWLRNLLESGLPPMNVEGTLMEPDYDTGDLRRATLESLARTALRNQLGGGSDESSGDSAARRLLDRLLD